MSPKGQKLRKYTELHYSSERDLVLSKISSPVVSGMSIKYINLIDTIMIPIHESRSGQSKISNTNDFKLKISNNFNN